MGQGARAAVSRPVTLEVAMRQAPAALAVLLVGVSVLAACGNEAAPAGTSRPRQAREPQANNVENEVRASEEPLVTWGIQYRDVRTPADMTSVPASIQWVWVLDGGDDILHALAARTDLQLARLQFRDAQITDAGLLEVAGLTSINHLYFLRCSRITKSGVMSLTAMPQLRSITVLQCEGISQQDCDDLRAALPSAVTFRDE